MGSTVSIDIKSSGAKDGTPENCIFSPSVRVSPILKFPWLDIPIMSPGHACSAVSRSLAKNIIGFCKFTSFPFLTEINFIPRLKLPDVIRKNAILSLCLGSIFA